MAFWKVIFIKDLHYYFKKLSSLNPGVPGEFLQGQKPPSPSLSHSALFEQLNF